MKEKGTNKAEPIYRDFVPLIKTPKHRIRDKTAPPKIWPEKSAFSVAELYLMHEVVFA